MTTEHAVLDAAADAALRIAADRPWREVTLRDIADAAKLPMTAFYGVARSKDDIVEAIMTRFDRAAADELDLAPDATARERVFDAVMARFDAMERERAGVASIMEDVFADPLAPVRFWPRATRTAAWLLELAGVDASGPAGAARTQGMLVILARATRAWLKDDAGDLSRTMATLDRSLRDVESWKERVAGWTRPMSDKARARTDSDEKREGGEPAEGGS